MNSIDAAAPAFARLGRRRRALELGVAALAVGVSYAALVLGIYYGLTRSAPGANDFYSRWMGARALLLKGQNPYAEQVTRKIQLGMYGRLARPDEDQVAFAYPLYAAYAAAPLVGLPYPWAQAFWMALLIIAVPAGALALAYVNRISLRGLMMPAVVLGALLFYPSVRGIFLGQYALLSFALIALAGLALDKEYDALAGVLLALSSVKPQPVVLLVPIILFWAWRAGRRRVVWRAVITLLVLVGTSFVLVPTWLIDFIFGLRNYAQYAPVGPPLETFFKLWLPPNFAFAAFGIASIALIGWLAVMVWRNKSSCWFDWQLTLGFAALVTTLVAGRIGTPDQVLLMILWMALFGVWLSGKGWLWAAASAAVLILLPWFVFFATLHGNQEAVVVTTILPLFSLVLWIGVMLWSARLRRTAVA